MTINRPHIDLFYRVEHAQAGLYPANAVVLGSDGQLYRLNPDKGFTGTAGDPMVDPVGGGSYYDDWVWVQQGVPHETHAHMYGIKSTESTDPVVIEQFRSDNTARFLKAQEEADLHRRPIKLASTNGVYYFTGPITFTKLATGIEGMGGNVHVSIDTAAGGFILDPDEVPSRKENEHLALERVRITGTSSGTADAAVLRINQKATSRPIRFSSRDLFIDGAAGDGLLIDGGVTIVFINFISRQCGGIGVRIQNVSNNSTLGANALTFIGGELQSNDVGALLEDTKAVKFVNTTIQGNDRSGVVLNFENRATSIEGYFENNCKTVPSDNHNEWEGDVVIGMKADVWTPNTSYANEDEKFIVNIDQAGLLDSSGKIVAEDWQYAFYDPALVTYPHTSGGQIDATEAALMVFKESNNSVSVSGFVSDGAVSHARSILINDGQKGISVNKLRGWAYSGSPVFLKNPTTNESDGHIIGSTSGGASGPSNILNTNQPLNWYLGDFNYLHRSAATTLTIDTSDELTIPDISSSNLVYKIATQGNAPQNVVKINGGKHGQLLALISETAPGDSTFIHSAANELRMIGDTDKTLDNTQRLILFLCVGNGQWYEIQYSQG